MILIALRRVVLIFIRDAIPAHRIRAQSTACKPWTKLSFELRKLDVKALAKRCDIAGGYWSNPDKVSEAFLDIAGGYWSNPDKVSEAFLGKAKARLQDLELEARTLLAKL
jgi:hypothetical protein